MFSQFIGLIASVLFRFDVILVESLEICDLLVSDFSMRNHRSYAS